MEEKSRFCTNIDILGCSPVRNPDLYQSQCKAGGLVFMAAFGDARRMCHRTSYFRNPHLREK